MDTPELGWGVGGLHTLGLAWTVSGEGKISQMFGVIETCDATIVSQAKVSVGELNGGSSLPAVAVSIVGSGASDSGVLSAAAST